MSAGESCCSQRSGVRTIVPAIRDAAARISSSDGSLGLDLDRDPERQLGQPDRGARVLPRFRPVQLEDQVGESVDHGRLVDEAGRRVDHPEDAQPARHAVEVAELALERPEDRERRQPRGLVALFERYLGADLAQHGRERAVRQLRAVAGEVDAVPGDARERDRKRHAGRRLQRLGKDEAERLQVRLDPHLATQGATPPIRSTVVRRTQTGGGSSIGGNFTSGPRHTCARRCSRSAAPPSSTLARPCTTRYSLRPGGWISVPSKVSVTRGSRRTFSSLRWLARWPETSSSPSTPIQTHVTCGEPSELSVTRWPSAPDSISPFAVSGSDILLSLA